MLHKKDCFPRLFFFSPLPNANDLNPEEVKEFVRSALIAASARLINTDIESVIKEQETENNGKF
jgi:hypothetical protein